MLTNRNPVGIIIKNGSGEYPRCRARFSQCNIFLIFPETEVLLSSNWPQLSSVCQHTRNADTRWSSMMLYSAQPSYHGRKERWQWTIKTNPLPEMLPSNIWPKTKCGKKSKLLSLQKRQQNFSHHRRSRLLNAFPDRIVRLLAALKTAPLRNAPVRTRHGRSMMPFLPAMPMTAAAAACTTAAAPAAFRR